MPRSKKKEDKKKQIPPATTPQGREDQLISLAIDVAEEQLRNGTASAQVVTHFLKLASSKEKLERDKLELENKLIKAKTEALESQKNIEELYSKAIKAMQTYSGLDDDLVEN